MATTTKKTTKKTVTKKATKKKTTKKVPMIEIKDLRKSYGKTEVLKGVNLTIHKGEKVAIIGANGAGKSTLTEIISTVKEKTSGEINYAFKDEKELKKNLGIQFQESIYPYWYKVIDIVEFFLEASGANLTKKEIDQMFKTFHIDGIQNKMARGLSGGQKQRLNILLAVIHKPEILLLDEVSTGLDIEAASDIKTWIKEYVEKTKSTLLLVSHNAIEIEYLTDRVVTIYDGIIYEDRTMAQIKKKYKTLDKYLDNLFLKKFPEEDKKRGRKSSAATESKLSFVQRMKQRRQERFGKR